MKYVFMMSIIALIGCKNTVEKSVLYPRDEFLVEKGLLIKYAYDSAGHKLSKKNFNADTVQVGAEIEYYCNGNARKWKWYKDTGDKYPVAIVYFDSLGNLDSLRGNPLLNDQIDSSGRELWLEIINPPVFLKKTVYLGRYEDIYKTKDIEKFCFVNGRENATYTAAISNFEFNEKHTYKFTFFCLDTSKIDPISHKFVVIDSVTEVYDTSNFHHLIRKL